MMGWMRTTTVGPSEGTLLLKTGVEGRAARLGHALTLRISEWACTATLDGGARENSFRVACGLERLTGVLHDRSFVLLRQRLESSFGRNHFQVGQLGP